GLDQLQLQGAKLNKSLPDFDVLFLAAEKVFGIRAIRPLNEPERPNPEKGSQQSRRLIQIRNDHADLDCLLQCNPGDGGFFRGHNSSSSCASRRGWARPALVVCQCCETRAGQA